MTLFFRQFRAELAKLFARKRTWMGFGAFFLLEVVILLLFQTNQAQRLFRRDFERNGAMAGLDALFDDYFRGLTIALIVVLFTILLLGGLFLALVSGDIVSKEAEDGTLRMTLCRPISRIRLLAIKYLTCLVYTFALVFFIGGTALLMGYFWRGLGGLFAFIPEEKLIAFFPPSEAASRFWLAITFNAAAHCIIASLAFMFSCFNIKPVSATIATLTILIADRILYIFPQLADYRHWFMASHIASWLNALRDPIPWGTMLQDYLYLLGMNATFVIIGMTIFCRRDFKS